MGHSYIQIELKDFPSEDKYEYCTKCGLIKSTLIKPVVWMENHDKFHMYIKSTYVKLDTTIVVPPLGNIILKEPDCEQLIMEKALE